VQLGTRWPLGAPPPASLPPVVAAAIRSVEVELGESDVDAAGWHWTLTYLERRPIVDLDDGTRIRYLPEADHAVVTSVDLDQAAESAEDETF
jgi:hypothetical protein